MIRYGRADAVSALGAVALWSLVVAPLSGCATGGRFQPDELAFSATDPKGDLLLRHPDAPGLERGSFDIEKVDIGVTDDKVIVTVEYAAQVEKIRWAWVQWSRPRPIYPQTVDIYLDTTPDAGFVESLPDRGFYVSAAESWDTVLVMTSVPSVRHPSAVHPTHLYHKDNRLIGVFDRSEVPGEIRGAFIASLATSVRGAGRIRVTSKSLGDCQVWNPVRCTLPGDGAPVLDAVGELVGGEVASLVYPEGQRPKVATYPVIFKREKMLSVAPIEPKLVTEGQLATVIDTGGLAVATAVVVSIVGDTASLEVIGEGNASEAESVTFGR